MKYTTRRLKMIEYHLKTYLSTSPAVMSPLGECKPGLALHTIQGFRVRHPSGGYLPQLCNDHVHIRATWWSGTKGSRTNLGWRVHDVQTWPACGGTLRQIILNITRWIYTSPACDDQMVVMVVILMEILSLISIPIISHNKLKKNYFIHVITLQNFDGISVT